MIDETTTAHTIATDFYQRINPLLMKWIQADAAVVLDVGCGAGRLGERYKQVNPLGRYWGMEPNQAAAQAAGKRLDKVWCIGAEQVSLAELRIQPKEIECLVYDAALAHMNNPGKVLAEHLEYLADTGTVLASIPNGQYWHTLSKLFRGDWDYTDAGIFAGERLHFFSADNIQEMFAKASLSIIDLQATRHTDDPGYQVFLSAFLPAARTLGISEDQFIAQTAAVRYNVRAVKTRVSSNPKLWIQTLLGDAKVCARARISEPNQFLTTIPKVTTEESTGKVVLRENDTSVSKVFIWQRVLPKYPQDLYKQKALIERGYLSVAEIDDDPLRWEAYHRENEFFAFRGCHGVQTSTEPLAEFLRQFNPHVAVFPNQLALLPRRRQNRRPWPVWLYFAALNREKDWQPIMPVLNQILNFYGDKVWIRVAHDKLFFDTLATSYKEYIPFSPFNTYMQLLYSSDINLLPLQANRFNAMKSDLKFIESAGCGAVALASPTVYENSIQHGITGVIFRDALDFGKKLSLLIENHEMRWQIADSAYDWVAANRMLSQHFRQRYNWYLDMYQRLPELNDLLRNRIPALFE